MRIRIQITLTIITGLLILASTGCATYKTISVADSDTAKIFSGTRLDIRALNGDNTISKKFTVAAPQYPAVDLPFSFLLDLIALPLTCGVALYESVFE
jgi:uncharacterized protein YceK